jgi:hypothetical protein
MAWIYWVLRRPYPRMAWIYWVLRRPYPRMAWIYWAPEKTTPARILRPASGPLPGNALYQRMTSTGSVLRASTSAVWLPSSTRVTPRRPCEVITIRSLLRWPAVSMMPSAA